MLIYARIPQYRVMYNELILALSPVPRVILSTIINYHEPFERKHHGQR